MKLIDPLPQACIQPLSKFGDVEALSILVRDLPGSVIEVGVWQGGMAAHILNLMPDRKIYLADTFTGVPYHDEIDGIHHVVGTFATDVNKVIELFKPYENVIILAGLFPDDFKDQLENETFRFVHLDVDVYKSYFDCLEFLYPRTVPGGVIILDDYKVASAPGCELAVDKYMELKLEKPILLRDTWYLLKRGA